MFDPFVKEINKRSLGLNILPGADVTATINVAIVSGLLEGDISFVATLGKEGIKRLPDSPCRHVFHTSIVFKN
jgi:hypothetical protein